MRVDKAWIADLRKKFKDEGVKGDRLDRLRDLIDEYTVACELSAGPDPNRCAHWEQVAEARRARLARFAEYGPEVHDITKKRV